MKESKPLLNGLTDQEVIDSRNIYGKNILNQKDPENFITSLKELILEPMFILLIIATSIYFITSDYGNGIFMIVAIIIISSISLYQESKSRKAIAALKKISEPKSKVIRNGQLVEIPTEEIVINDLIQTEEGTFVPADGIILQSNDFSVDESILTGESLPVFKNEKTETNHVFQGTIITSGLAICKVTAIGNKTELGKIGKSLESISEEKTPLQVQINGFVRNMSIIGLVVFGIVWAINYHNSKIILDSLLKALTLAMSIIPEEIPVAFTTFMALGAWRLIRIGIVAKQNKTVETLGSTTVICVDKTGTITENTMSLAQWYTFETDKLSEIGGKPQGKDLELLELAMFASEPIPFDPMEIALHEMYSKWTLKDKRSEFEMIHEYPLEGKPPMMTHIYENDEKVRIIAAKGAPEALIACSNLTDIEKQKISETILTLSKKGFRVLGVGTTFFENNNFPEKQQDLNFQFKGLVAFYDPPKENIKSVFEEFYKAGIQIKIVTGDNPATTATIAEQIGFKNTDQTLNGDELMKMDDKTLREKVMRICVFTRMFPEAKLKIIKALKENNQIVAMTGDGINDGPALKSAHIGIAMGKRGTEIAKQAANLILVDDDLSKMIDSIAMGRKIYSNLKKAVQYIISIHIPIILTVFIPLALGWKFPNIFSPVHVIFFEVIMGPTCSIIYENEPIEKNLMLTKPRHFTTTFFNFKEIIISIIQGLAITIGALIIYQICTAHQCPENTVRTTVFLTLIVSNICLTLCNRSFYYSVFTTLKYKNKLIPMIIFITVLITGVLIFVPPFAKFFRFEIISGYHLLLSISIGFLSVIWIEIYKWFKRRNPQKSI